MFPELEDEECPLLRLKTISIFQSSPFGTISSAD